MAGRYIIEQLEEENPKQYIAVLAKLLIKAQQEDDENIVSNHYLQIKAILDMSTEENKNLNTQTQDSSAGNTNVSSIVSGGERRNSLIGGGNASNSNSMVIG